jgi:hypothetical protein
VKVFNDYCDFDFPEKLKEIYLIEKIPIDFLLKGRPFVLEVQYLLDVDDINNYDDGKFAFAVDGNGNKLLVELNSGLFEIYLEESGDVEEIDARLDDIIL